MDDYGDLKIIDAHIHCGVQNVHQPFEMIVDYLKTGGISGACLFAPVEDVYDRYDYNFKDNAFWQVCRKKANEYVLKIQETHEFFWAFYFVWNDFPVSELKKGFRGVKWHRHEYEPVYNYDDPACDTFLQTVFQLRLPIILEETFHNTIMFISRVDGKTPIIIPHLGALNGGFYALFHSGIWDLENVYADTALASQDEIEAFINRYGVEKLIFGSDFPFGIPSHELSKVRRLGLSMQDFEKVVCKNIRQLMGC
ncbi:MAG: amidohydrolase [Syntrophales bacterium]|nr:amidohydrolase [Syntrophales bacterium]